MDIVEERICTRAKCPRRLESESPDLHRKPWLHFAVRFGHLTMTILFVST
jgi:hypothetical protein